MSISSVRHDDWKKFVDNGKPGDIYVNPAQQIFVFIEKYVDEPYEYIQYVAHYPDGSSADVSTNLGRIY